MAVEEPVNRIDDFTNYYAQIIAKMFGEEGAQKKSIENIVSSFEELELTSEQKGTLIGELAVQTAINLNRDATNASLELLKIEPEFELKAAQRDVSIAQAKLTDRQRQGYDDNMLLKLVEEQGGLASFAVNAGSDTAQTTINDLKAKMLLVQERVTPLTGLPSCPVPTPITPIVTNFISSSITSSSITLSWNAVTGGTSYLLYKDGILLSTSSALNFTDTGLTASTKYAYTVKASINGILSDHTNALVVTTSV